MAEISVAHQFLDTTIVDKLFNGNYTMLIILWRTKVLFVWHVILTGLLTAAPHFHTGLVVYRGEIIDNVYHNTGGCTFTCI